VGIGPSKDTIKSDLVFTVLFSSKPFPTFSPDKYSFLNVCMYLFQNFFLAWYTNYGYNVGKIFMQHGKYCIFLLNVIIHGIGWGTLFFHIGAG
jgi:hypothetical protein